MKYLKIILLNIVGIIFFITIKGQSIEIKLEVKWYSNNCPYFLNDSSKNIPYLVVKYYNNSKTPYYFLKPIKNCNENLKFPVTTNFKKFNWRIIDEYCNFFLDSSFYVILDAGPNLFNSWLVKNNLFNESEIDELNTIFYDFYDSIVPSCLKKTNNNYEFPSCDIKGSNIISFFYNSFIFLDSMQIYEEKFNLIGFVKIPANYEFILNKDSSYDYINITCLKENKNEVYYKQIALPLFHQIYYLYNKSFIFKPIKFNTRK